MPLIERDLASRLRLLTPDASAAGDSPVVRQRPAKYAADRAVAAAALLALSPLLLLIFLCIAMTSSGPVIYRQNRIGEGGRAFRIYKFRTMYHGADSQLERLLHLHDRVDTPLFKVPDDPRVTRVGRLLRRSSLDELPQFINVLRGEMSLVGPRPQRPQEVALYHRDHHHRLSVRPGITGLWQVSGRSELGWPEAVRLDLAYVENWSWWLDLQILLLTIPAVLTSRGAA